VQFSAQYAARRTPLPSLTRVDGLLATARVSGAGGAFCALAEGVWGCGNRRWQMGDRNYAATGVFMLAEGCLALRNDAVAGKGVFGAAAL
jgi:hypothetical protein